MEPSKQRLRELLEYEKKTGRFRNKVWRGNRSPKGKYNSRSANEKRYERIQIDDRRMSAHRAVWIWHYGTIPPDKQVDHIDRNRMNNRIENLRLVTAQQNRRNTSKYRTNTSGATGVDFMPGKQLWRARLSTTHLGWYKTFEEALAVRNYAVRQEVEYTRTHGQ